MPIGRHHHGGAETDARGMSRQMGEQLERSRRDGHFDSMMLGRPDDVETALVRHLHHFRDVTHDVAHIGRVGHPLRVDHQIESHGIPRIWVPGHYRSRVNYSQLLTDSQHS